MSKIRQIVNKIIIQEMKNLIENSYPEDMTYGDDKKMYDGFEDKAERDLWWKATSLRRKYMTMNKFKPGTAPFIKSQVNKAFSDLDRYQRNKEKSGLNMETAKKIFKSHGLKSTSYQSTSIRGYSIPSSNSYEISKHDPSNIEFNGISSQTFEAIVSELEKQGFNVVEKRPPSKVPGGPNHGSIRLKKQGA